MPHKQKAKMEENVKLVCACIEGKMSQSDASQEAGEDRKTIYRWIAQYETEGSSAFLPRERNRAYPPEMKQKAVQDYLKGNGSLLDICRKYEIHSDRQLRDGMTIISMSTTSVSSAFAGRRTSGPPSNTGTWDARDGQRIRSILPRTC